MTRRGIEYDKAERKVVAVEQDGKFVGIGAAWVSGISYCRKLGESAKTT
jgi:hypothetical protein